MSNADKTIDIADAIVAFLPTQAYSGLQVTADNCDRRYIAIRNVKELASHRIIIIPVRRVPEMMSRGCAERLTYYVNVLVEQQCDEGDNATIDPLRNLAVEILDHLKDQQMAGATWLGSEEQVFADQELLVQNKIYVSENQIRYRR